MILIAHLEHTLHALLVGPYIHREILDQETWTFGYILYRYGQMVGGYDDVGLVAWRLERMHTNMYGEIARIRIRVHLIIATPTGDF